MQPQDPTAQNHESSTRNSNDLNPGSSPEESLDSQPQPNTVTAKLKFLSPLPLYKTEKPFQIFTNIPPEALDQRTTNLVFEDHAVQITDIRSLPEKVLKRDFTLDQKGFVYEKHKTKMKKENFDDQDMIERVYLPEVEDLIRKELEGREVGKVFIFDWRLRKNAPEIEGSVIDMNDLTSWLRPAMHVHIDQSPAAVLNRIQLQLPDEADELLQQRVQVINVWRPLVPAITDWPLTICDGRTVNPSHLMEADHIRRHYMGSTLYLTHSPSHSYYYMSNQTPEDVLVFKNFDSEEGVIGFAPHASFHHPLDTGHGVPRASIEVRALVFSAANTSYE